MGIRYQTGALERRKTALGLCWFIRFCGPNGARPRFRVGLVSEMNKTQVRKAAESIRRRFNSPDGFEPDTAPAPVALFKDVIDHYERVRMPERYSTSQSYKSMLKVHIRPTWGQTPAKDVRSAAVEAWLLDLKLAPKTRGHIKGLMSVLFRFAMHHNYIPIAENPMRLFPMSTARKKEPRILTRKEFKLLVEKMPVGIFRTMVIVCGCLGLRASEVAGLRWEDIDWLKREIHIRNGVVNGRIGDVKTKASRRKLPLSPSLFRELEARRRYSEFKEFDDFIFASPYSAGEKPL